MENVIKILENHRKMIERDYIEKSIILHMAEPDEPIHDDLESDLKKIIEINEAISILEKFEDKNR